MVPGTGVARRQHRGLGRRVPLPQGLQPSVTSAAAAALLLRCAAAAALPLPCAAATACACSPPPLPSSAASAPSWPLLLLCAPGRGLPPPRVQEAASPGRPHRWPCRSQPPEAVVAGRPHHPRRPAGRQDRPHGDQPQVLGLAAGVAGSVSWQPLPLQPMPLLDLQLSQGPCLGIWAAAAAIFS